MNFRFKMNVTPQTQNPIKTHAKEMVEVRKLEVRKWSMIDRVHTAKTGCGSCGR